MSTNVEHARFEGGTWPHAFFGPKPAHRLGFCGSGPKHRAFPYCQNMGRSCLWLQERATREGSSNLEAAPTPNFQFSIFHFRLSVSRRVPESPGINFHSGPRLV